MSGKRKIEADPLTVRAADKVVLAVQPVFDESLALSACRAVL